MCHLDSARFHLSSCVYIIWPWRSSIRLTFFVCFVFFIFVLFFHNEGDLINMCKKEWRSYYYIASWCYQFLVGVIFVCLFVCWLVVFFFPPFVKPSWDVRTLCVLPNKKQDVALPETNNAPYTTTWKKITNDTFDIFFFFFFAPWLRCRFWSLRHKNLTMLSVYALTITHSPGARCYPEHFALLSLKCIYILMARRNWALFWHGKTRFTLCRKRKRTFFVNTTSWGRKFRRENDNLNIFVIRTEVLRTTVFHSCYVHGQGQMGILLFRLQPYFHWNVQYTAEYRGEGGAAHSFYKHWKEHIHTLSVKMAVSAFAALSGTLFLRSRKFATSQ